MRVLIVGAAGFVGEHVTRYFLELTDCDVVTLDRHPRIRDDGTKHVIHELRNPIIGSSAREIGKVDAVINLAASSDVVSFLQKPDFHATNTFLSTLNLLEWAREQKLHAFIQVSTNEVYGPALNHDTKEWASIIPQTPYSAAKAAQEALAIGWWRTYDVPTVVVNTMHLFGEDQPPKRFIPTATQAILRDEPVPIFGINHGYGWSAPVRQWTYVRDFAAALHWILTHDVARYSETKMSKPDRWNVAGAELSCKRVATMIADKLQLPISVDWQQVDRPGYDMRYALDTTALKRFGFLEPYGTAEGISRTVHWIKQREKM